MGDTAEPLLETRGLSKRFGGVHALERFDFQLAPGEVVALAGDNGAGKSTFTKIVSGVYLPSDGEILVGGRPVTFDGPQDARRQGIETIYQDLALADNLDIGANVFLGRELMTRFLFLPRVDRRRMREEAAGALAVLDVHLDRLDRPVRALSGGQRQAVAIGRAIHFDARVIIMDEPTAALGVPEQRKVMDLIRNLRAKGLGVIFISHNLADMFAVSDRIVVLRRGQLAGERRVGDTEPEEIVRLMVGRDGAA
ncbi:ATP-binding cassette domain-containing protein [Lichenicoccus roseus]|uniref:Sugar ABC transporter ATP-binding protein n=1 Tax=Lichenicoccus roseus TaxID=2683649 RepID=A0A5R9J5B2_9PROT|nr:ATP-binding cassette domain-containing protein [Lichenicoccus roseus]TLU71697.1 sugar ABC transporter ATP-binding protein [Lichenicoccus roseus]